MTVLVTAVEERTTLDVIRDYVSLLKLRVVSLLLVTAVAVMFPAAHGWPHPLLVLVVLAGGTLAAGGAHSINCWFDRDIDARMGRTHWRPVAAGRIPPSHALILGIVLNVLAFAILWAGANLLAALLALSGTLIYVLVYTVWLKRTTPQNIVIGGAAGAVPPLVGWAAVTGRLDLTALSLFLVIFLWTPPHFWALAQVIGDDYRRARVPMLPVVLGETQAKRQSAVYATLTLLASLIPVATGQAGSVYAAGALVLGIGLVAITILDLTRSGWTRAVFRYSIAYLGALFAIFAVSAFMTTL